MIKIDFEFTTQFGIFRDALYLEDNHNLTQEDIELLKKERVDNWIAIVSTSPTDEVV